MIVNIGSEGTTIDASGSGREEAEVGFDGEDDGIGAGVSRSECG